MTSIRKELFWGIIFTAWSKYTNILIQIVMTVILSRLLTPAEYGIVAIANIFIAFFNILCDIGIGPAIIQYKDLSKYELEHIFSFTAYIGFLISFVFFISSWPIALYYGNEDLIPVCQILSFTILFNCLNIVPLNLHFQKKKFEMIATVTLSIQLTGAISAIILAFSGFGVFSLVTQQIVTSFAMFLFFSLRSKLSLHLIIDKEPLKRIVEFSVYQFLFNIINYFSRNTDKLLIGKFIGLSSLAQYEKSYHLMLMPLQNITFVVTPVMQPIFSDFFKDLHEMAEKYMKVFEVLCFIGFPLSVLLYFCSNELILLFFGQQWLEAITPFRILSLTVGLQILNGTSGSIYQAAKATKQLFISGCWCAFFMLSCFTTAIIVWSTIEAVAISFVIAQIFNTSQTYYLLFKTLNYPLINAIKVSIYPIFITCIIGVVLYIISLIMINQNIIVSLFVKCSITFLLWGILVEYFGTRKGLIKEISNVIIKKKN